MKKDRNCSGPYPIYPMPYQGMAPMMGQNPIVGQSMMGQTPMMSQNMMGQNQMMQPMYSGNIEQQLNSLSNQVTTLERRVSSLEGLIGSNTNYNTSNFQMM